MALQSHMLPPHQPLRCDEAWTVVVRVMGTHEEREYPVDYSCISRSSHFFATAMHKAYVSTIATLNNNAATGGSTRLTLILKPQDAEVFPIAMEFMINGKQLPAGMPFRHLVSVYRLSHFLSAPALRGQIMRKMSLALGWATLEDVSYLIHTLSCLINESNSNHSDKCNTSNTTAYIKHDLTHIGKVLLSIPFKRENMLRALPVQDLKVLLGTAQLVETWQNQVRYDCVEVRGAGTREVNGVYHRSSSGSRFFREASWRGIPCRFSLWQKRSDIFLDKATWQIIIMSRAPACVPSLLFYESRCGPHRCKPQDLAWIAPAAGALGIGPAPNVFIVPTLLEKY